MKHILRKTMIFSCLLAMSQAHGMSFFASNSGKSTSTSQPTAPVSAPKSRSLEILQKNCKDLSIQLWLSKCESLYGFENAEQILQQAIDEKRSDIIKFMMPHASKEDRGTALLYAVKSNSADMVTELLKHKVAEKALWKSLTEIASSYKSDKEHFTTLILQHMKSLNLTENHVQELTNHYNSYSILHFLSHNIVMPSNVQNIIVRALAKSGQSYNMGHFLNDRSVQKSDLTTVQQHGISDRAIRKIAQDNTSQDVASLLAKKLYENKKEQISTYRKFDIAMLQTWTDNSKADFYKHYDSVRTVTTCSNAVVDNVTQTAHLVHNFLLLQGLATRLMKQPTINSNNYSTQDLAYDLIKTNMINRVCQHEKEFDTQGYQTFYHGRSWEWNFANDMWRMLCALKDNTAQMPDLVALRFRSGTQSNATLQSYRKDLMANGPSNYGGTGTTASGKDAELTCMNRTILTNSSSSAICTGSYFLNNCSIASSGQALRYVEKMFKDHNMHALYLKFESNIKQLAADHQKTSERGELLCIAVRKNCLDSMVYVSCGYGSKDPNAVASKFLEEKDKNAALNPTETEDGSSYFCLAVSDIPGEYGDKYTIKSLHNADPVKYDVYQKQLDSLFADMKKAK
ncbi:MAG: hypothetical protein WC747_03995 [Candidatus Babeliales bacterium]